MELLNKMIIITNALIEASELKLPALIRNYDYSINQPTDGQTDQRAIREVSLQIIISFMTIVNNQ